jgi:hypothetical protein
MAAPPGGSPYVPPKQSGWGQFRDALLPIVLVFIILFGSTYLLQATSSPPHVRHQTLNQLPITPAERSQYEKLIAAGDVTLDQVDQAVQTQRPNPHKYSLNVPLLLGILALIGVYLWFVFGVSFRQYREVIAEKFGPAAGTEPR